MTPSKNTINPVHKRFYDWVLLWMRYHETGIFLQSYALPVTMVYLRLKIMKYVLAVTDPKIQLSERLGYKVTFIDFLNWFDCTGFFSNLPFVKMVFENWHLVGLLKSSRSMFVNFSIFLQAWKNLCYTPLQSHCHIISFSCHMFLGLV